MRTRRESEISLDTGKSFSGTILLFKLRPHIKLSSY